MTASVLDFFANEGTKDLLARLAAAGVNMRYTGEEKTDKLAGKTLSLIHILDVYKRQIKSCSVRAIIIWRSRTTAWRSSRPSCP